MNSTVVGAHSRPIGAVAPPATLHPTPSLHPPASPHPPESPRDLVAPPPQGPVAPPPPLRDAVAPPPPPQGPVAPSLHPPAPSIVHARPTFGAITRARLAVVLTVVGWLAYVGHTIAAHLADPSASPIRLLILVTATLSVTALSFSALSYLVARYGALVRLRGHERASHAELDEHFGGHDAALAGLAGGTGLAPGTGLAGGAGLAHGAGLARGTAPAAHDASPDARRSTPLRTLTVLIPSYAEETRVVRATLWSAALQEYPHLRVVLLLDDPPHPANPDAAARLDATRRLATEVSDALRGPASRFRRAWDHSLSTPSPPTWAELAALATHYDHAAAWLETMAAAEPPGDHTDTFFVEEVLRGLAGDLARTAAAVRSAIGSPSPPTRRRVSQLHARLVWIFEAEVTVFERKRYVSLSHEANKAMNLNSYISLMGGRWVEEPTAEGVVLRPAGPGGWSDDDGGRPAHPGGPSDDDGGPAHLVIPASDYLLTLDADSLLLREYCLRLVHLLEQPGNERVAIAQTPYSSFPGAPSRLERIAGATTDLQHLQHQGKTHFDATFWVGANAVIRRAALEDIVEVRTERGHPVRVYIQDRTVIEDTESTIDLGAHGWTLLNYPERLSYSATPPDFGSLVVQRRRWANGGLVIMPKLFRIARERRRPGAAPQAGEPVRLGGVRARAPMRPGEFWLRTDYLGSIAWSSAALVLLLVLPDAASLLSPLVFAGSVPYFVAMAADLRRTGHRGRDVFWVYAFNLVLLPVNLAGVLKSLQQAVTGQKIPFARTPKVHDRTAAPALHVLLPWVIAGVFGLAAAEHAEQHTWGGLVFALVSGCLTLVGAVTFIGVRNAAVDARLGILTRVREVARRRRAGV